MIFGVDYYPEHWPEGRWAVDARMMREVGLQVVRLAEFAWGKMEPSEGQFEWNWLDRAITALAAEGLQIVLGTPTAAAPAWLARAYPETLPVGENGQRREFGSRRHYCPNNLEYRRHTHRIVAGLARRYGNDARVIGWQIDNEFGGGHTARCYCPSCAAAFRSWLQRRYGDIESLNYAWGNVFWSQSYNEWSQILPPNGTVAVPNPSHVLDYYRFASDAYVEYQQLQIDILREEVDQRQFITHNFMGLYQDLDQYRLAAGLDFASWDSYPTGNPDRWRMLVYPPGVDTSANDPAYAYDVGDPVITGMAHDLTRGLKQAPFWVMEQQCGQINWGEFNSGVRPGTVRLWVWHALASGANGVIFFRWRAGLAAQEQYHSGMLHHDATPDVGYRELLAMLSERDLMDQVASAPLDAPVALLLDFEDLWAWQIQPHRKNLGYLRSLFAFYRTLQRLGIRTDILSPHSDLSSYKLVIAPTLLLVDEPLARHLEAYTKGGGTLMLGIRSGFKTRSNQVTDQPLPGLLADLAGITVAEWQALPPNIKVELRHTVFGLTGAAGYWIESLVPRDEGIKVHAHYASGPFSGQAAMTEHNSGLGRVIYLGWYPTEPQVQTILVTLTDQLGVPHYHNLPRGLQVVTRGPYVVLLNFTDSPLTANLHGKAVTVNPRDVVVHY